MLDFGQFGAPIALTSFNYADGIVKGVEFNASYDEGPWSVYFNGAFGNGIGRNINSAQFSFGAAELAYIANNYIILDHTQGWTFSAGAAYTFNANSEWATKVSTDMLFGSGLRTTVVTPNDCRCPTMPSSTRRWCKRYRSVSARERSCASTSSTCSTTNIRSATAWALASALPSSDNARLSC